MGIHLVHNIRIRLARLKKNLRPDLAPLNLLFFQCLLRQVGVAPFWPCHALVLLAPNSWDSFCTSNSSVRILKKTWNFFSKWYNFHNLLKVISFQKNISSSFFQYSDRTVASTETNDTSAESLWSQLFGGRRTRAWHGQEGATLTCRKRHWKKK